MGNKQKGDNEGGLIALAQPAKQEFFFIIADFEFRSSFFWCFFASPVSHTTCLG
jgi:hypothetical protein